MSISPRTLGSKYKWQFTLTKDTAVWDVSAVVCVFWWKRPDGSKFSQTADTATALGVVTYTDTAAQLNQVGAWTVSVFITGFGYVAAQDFLVVYSP